MVMTMNDCIMILFIDCMGKFYNYFLGINVLPISANIALYIYCNLYQIKSISNVSFEMLNNNRHNVTVDKILHQETFLVMWSYFMYNLVLLFKLVYSVVMYWIMNTNTHTVLHSIPSHTLTVRRIWLLLKKRKKGLNNRDCVQL